MPSRSTPAASSPPRPVEPGDRLRLIAPAGPFDPERFSRGVAWLREHFEVDFADDIHDREGYLAGDDGRRLAELDAALASDAHAILAVRGGFGCTRLLPRLDPERIRAAGKPLIGFSDLTALHALWSRAGVGSWHAPMVAWLGGAEPDTRQAWLEELATVHASMPLAPLIESEAVVEGPLAGGNLAVLAALLGTPHAPDLAGRVLFLEEIGEAPYRIDRMLTSLGQSGAFDGVAGWVLGDLTGCTGRHGTDAFEVFADHARRWGVPAWRGVPSGHGDRNRALPFGQTARVGGHSLVLL